MFNIIEKYNESHRYYHTIKHISDMLYNMNHFNFTQIERVTLQYAIYFHDYVYDPKSKMNEKNSAIDFLEFANSGNLQLSNKIPIKEFKHAVFNMILDTKHHEPSIEMSKYLIDLDLWDLADDIKYIKNRELIRQEYHMYSDLEFNEGRKKWIESFLAKTQIYYTNYCIENKFESKARVNLQNELK